MYVLLWYRMFWGGSLACIIHSALAPRFRAFSAGPAPSKLVCRDGSIERVHNSPTTAEEMPRICTLSLNLDAVPISTVRYSTVQTQTGLCRV